MQSTVEISSKFFCWYIRLQGSWDQWGTIASEVAQRKIFPFLCATNNTNSGDNLLQSAAPKAGAQVLPFLKKHTLEG